MLSLLPILLADFCPCPVASCPKDRYEPCITNDHGPRRALGGVGQVAVRVSAESGFDPGYMLKGQAEQAAGERTAGGYYINAA